VMLGVGGDHPALVQDGSCVQRMAALGMIRVVRTIQIADNGDKIAEAPTVQAAGEPGDGDPGSLDEGLPQGQVLDRVAGERHLGEQDQVGTCNMSPLGPLHNEVCIGGDVADRRVELSKSDSKVRHFLSVSIWCTGALCRA
jgi:hypothetical protein